MAIGACVSTLDFPARAGRAPAGGRRSRRSGVRARTWPRRCRAAAAAADARRDPPLSPGDARPGLAAGLPASPPPRPAGGSSRPRSRASSSWSAGATPTAASIRRPPSTCAASPGARPIGAACGRSRPTTCARPTATCPSCRRPTSTPSRPTARWTRATLDKLLAHGLRRHRHRLRQRRQRLRADRPGAAGSPGRA